MPRRAQTRLLRVTKTHAEGGGEGGGLVGKGRLQPRKRWKEEGVRSEWEGAAAQADPGAGTQVLATGRPLEERTDWPAIGSRQSPVGRRAGPRSQTVSSGPGTFRPGVISAPLIRSRGWPGLAAAGPVHTTGERVEPRSSPTQTHPCALGPTRTAKSFAWGLGVWEVGGDPEDSAQDWRARLLSWDLGQPVLHEGLQEAALGRGSVRTGCRAGGAQWGTADDSTTGASPYLWGRGRFQAQTLSRIGAEFPLLIPGPCKPFGNPYNGTEAARSVFSCTH